VTLSACLIAKGDEPSLARAIETVQPFVDEVVLVVTGSTLSPGVEADKIAFYDGCNVVKNCTGLCGCHEGDIIDFAAARNRSFELASGDHIVWLDSDDEIVGGAHLKTLAEENQQILSPYQYAFDTEGRTTDLFWLPRIVSRDKRWSYPIHEELTKIEPGQKRSDSIWRHHRGSFEGQLSAQRNLRVCQHHASNVQWENDARFWYFFAHSYMNVGRNLKAVELFIKAFQLRPEPHLLCIAAQKIARCLSSNPLAVEWAHRALALQPTWPSCSFLLADVYDAQGDPHIATQFARMGLTLRSEDTTWPVDPTLRTKWQARIYP
jgi:glycosyltransferase involved in cell wall biosynthesis